MSTQSRNQLGLTTGQWTVLLIALILALFTVWELATLYQWALDKNEQISLTVGAIALAVSAYSAMSSNRLKSFEIDKGFKAAKALIEVDAHEALKESSETYTTLMASDQISIEQWDKVVNRLKTLEKRYERRQDQLPFLAAHLPPDKFLKIQSFYLELERHFDVTEELKIPSNAMGIDIDALFKARKKILKSSFKESEKRILGQYQELEFQQLPKDIQNRLIG